jgi:hypothetical protein
LRDNARPWRRTNTISFAKPIDASLSRIHRRPGVHRVAPNWPLECAVLCPPASPEFNDEAAATMLLKDLDPEIRALGFSDTGKTLVVANTRLFLWRR